MIAPFVDDRDSGALAYGGEYAMRFLCLGFRVLLCGFQHRVPHLLRETQRGVGQQPTRTRPYVENVEMRIEPPCDAQRRLEHAHLAVELAGLLALGDERAEARGGVERRDARAARADALG